MKFGAPRKLSSKASWVDGSVESSRAYSRTKKSQKAKEQCGSLDGSGNQYKQYHNLIFWAERKKRRRIRRWQ
ncbi:hypothetical protein B0J14DRAFT_602305 [Halenospora varia]|nr:hypothetical protein B0J14DRAFT_602305 [Halenospora varia]